ncbi:MAG: bifunctional UDP-N-acetylmuramoyl-tripeptide:D-alanyl-D-alanine ligase/alanine racemase [Bacteroidetes bacterium]|nr:MAG: bifunctional UDP-N-acetylmuramoyl-tripeptide:D-alanyl-D-alanine ligase/alanine racemase [Bacteroidota bacterium]
MIIPEQSITDICREIPEAQPVLYDKQMRLSQLAFDSRLVYNPVQTLFIALRGAARDGHDYVFELYEKGVRNFIVEESFDHTRFNANFVVVPHTLKALQHWAKNHRAKYHLPVIGITGSNGKTVVKEWLYQLLHKREKIARSPRSYNSQIGLPLSVLQISSSHTLGIFEAGISQKGEMQKLFEILQPQYGIFTNIGDAHNANFQSVDEKCKEKAKLFQKSEKVIFSADYLPVKHALENILPPHKLVSWSVNKNVCKYKVETVVREEKSEIGIYTSFGKQVFTIPFVDKGSVENAIHIFILLMELGCNVKEFVQDFENLQPVSMRLSMSEGKNNSLIINDAYNSDLESLENALEYLAVQGKFRKKIAVISDIISSEKDKEQIYKELAHLVNTKNIAELIAIGPDLMHHQTLFKELNTRFYPDTDTFIHDIVHLDLSNTAVLLKGARKFKFEKISKIIEAKQHTTVLNIDLSALAHNYKFFKSKLRKNTKVMAMVKAMSYGSGHHELAFTLEQCGADYFGVAYADEGIALRKAGVTKPVMVMNPEKSSYSDIIKYRLEPEIYDFDSLKSFCKAVESFFDPVENFPVHIKLDTGMHRLGFLPEEIEQLSEALQETRPYLKVQSVFSHLADADNPDKQFTLRQIALYEQMYDMLSKALGYNPVKHILNTAGVLYHSKYQFDMVRLGIGLYGIGGQEKNLQNVATFKTKISQIKTAKKGEYVGYSCAEKMIKDTLVAIIPAGYADGIDRRLGNGNAAFLVNGKLAPTIGNICMDMCMIDVSGIKNVKSGDEVIIFGKDLSPKMLADRIGTIPYEILTGVSHRVKRTFFKE